MCMCCLLAGTCSSAQTEAIPGLHPETSVSCHLGFTSDVIDFSANDVIKTHTSFDSSIGKTGLNLDQSSHSWLEGFFSLYFDTNESF